MAWVYPKYAAASIRLADRNKKVDRAGETDGTRKPDSDETADETADEAVNKGASIVPQVLHKLATLFARSITSFPNENMQMWSARWPVSSASEILSHPSTR